VPVFPHSGHRIVSPLCRDRDHENSTKCKVHARHLNECANTPSRSASWTPPLVSANGARSSVRIIVTKERSPFGSAGSYGRPFTTGPCVVRGPTERRGTRETPSYGPASGGDASREDRSPYL